MKTRSALTRFVASGLLFACAAMAQAATVLTDLPGISVTANACYLAACDTPGGTFSASNAIDHKSYDYANGGKYSWGAGDHGTPGDPNWLRIDFGALYQLSELWLENGDTRGVYQGFTHVYELYGSADGVNWQQLGGGTLTDLTGNAAALSDDYSWSGATAPLARWIEYREVGGSHWSSLSEIRVLGELSDAPANPIPEPASLTLIAAGLAAMGLLTRRRRRD